MNGPAAEYVGEISKKMIYPKSVRRRFLENFTPLIECYCSEHPDATYDDLRAEFGNPDSFQSLLADRQLYREMLENAETKARRLKLLSILLGVILVLAVFLAAYLIGKYSSGTLTNDNTLFFSYARFL